MHIIKFLIKEFFDRVGAFLGIIILLPFFVMIAIWIKVESNGPIFFFQERLGKNGRVFRIIKFRTMVINAENIGNGLHVREDNDERITRSGRILRASSLDEIPQLLNVLIGDMSLVGPRPPVTYYPYKYDGYSDEQLKRFTMKPGITGLAQVMVRNSVPWDMRIQYDIKYVKYFSLTLDLQILCKTLVKVFRSDAIYDTRVSSNEDGQETK